MRCSVAAPGTENIGSPALELRFPRCDLIGVDVELFRQLSQRSIAPDGGKRHLRLTWGRSGQVRYHQGGNAKFPVFASVFEA